MTWWDGVPIVPPPETFTVEVPDKRPVLYRANGTPLVRRGIGFRTDCSTGNRREMERKS